MSIATLVLAVATRADSAPRPEIATQAHSAISCRAVAKPVITATSETRRSRVGS
jgi:hypothetical protein